MFKARIACLFLLCVSNILPALADDSETNSALLIQKSQVAFLKILTNQKAIDYKEAVNEYYKQNQKTKDWAAITLASIGGLGFAAKTIYEGEVVQDRREEDVKRARVDFLQTANELSKARAALEALERKTAKPKIKWQTADLVPPPKPVLKGRLPKPVQPAPVQTADASEERAPSSEKVADEGEKTEVVKTEEQPDLSITIDKDGVTIKGRVLE